MSELVCEPILNDAIVISSVSCAFRMCGGVGAAILGAAINTSSSQTVGRGLGKVFAMQLEL
jgi:hypothetical protein